MQVIISYRNIRVSGTITDVTLCPNKKMLVITQEIYAINDGKQQGSTHFTKES